MSLALFLAAAATAASAYANPVQIDNAVAHFTGAAIGQPGGALQPVDRRLRLNPCAAPLALAWRTARRDSVVVQCPDIGGWRLFVPVNAYPVATLPEPPAINRGDAVTIAVEGEGFSISRPGEAMEAGPAGQWIRVRPVAGEPIRARVVRPGLVAVALP